MARSEIIKDFINSNMSISKALQNLMVILYCLEDDKLIKWAENELSGYGEYDELPAYRKLEGIVFADYMIGRAIYKETVFPIGHLDKDLQESLSNIGVFFGVDTLEELKGDTQRICSPIPPEFCKKLQEQTNAHIISAHVRIGSVNIRDILPKIRTKIIQTLIFLEKEFGNLDDLDIDISIKNKEDLEKIKQHICIQLYDNSVTIGDNNKFKKSDVITNR